MKKTKIAFAVAYCVLLGACGSSQPHKDSPTYRVGPQYKAKGHIDGVNAYVYGDRTLLQYKRKPLLLTIRDTNGNAVGYSEEGNFYRLDRQLDEFSARINLIQATDFKIDPSRKAPANPSPPRPTMSFVAQELTASDAQILAADSLAYLADSLPPARTTIILDPPLNDQHDALSGPLELSLRSRGYGVLVVDPKTGIAAGQGTPLRYLASPVEQGVVLRLQFHGKEAKRFYPRSSGGKLLSNGAPFTVIGSK